MRTNERSKSRFRGCHHWNLQRIRANFKWIMNFMKYAFALSLYSQPDPCSWPASCNLLFGPHNLQDAHLVGILCTFPAAHLSHHTFLAIVSFWLAHHHSKRTMPACATLLHTRTLTARTQTRGYTPKRYAGRV